MIGYLHFGGAMGDGVRVRAIREKLIAKNLPFCEFPWQRSPGSADMVRQVLSLRALRHATRKALRDRSHSVLRELHWGVEIDAWQAQIARGVAEVEREAPRLRVLLAESLFAGIAAAEVKRRTGLPFVFDMHGAASQEALLSGASEWIAFAAEAERRVMRAADRIVAASPVMADFVRQSYGIPAERVSVIPNGSDVSERVASYAVPATIVFAGNLAGYERVDQFVAAAERATGDGRFRFWLVGDGVKREELLSYANARFVDMLYWGRRHRPEALDLCARAQIGFVGQSGDPALTRRPAQLFCPIKLFDYASCGLPVVIAPGEWSALVERHDCGVVARTPDAEAFLRAAETLLDRDTWERKARNAREMVRSGYQWTNLLEPLGALLEDAAAAAH